MCKVDLVPTVYIKSLLALRVGFLYKQEVQSHPYFANRFIRRSTSTSRPLW